MNSEWAAQPQPDGGGASGPGPQLKAQREAMGWSVDQVADQLKLAQRQVVALEEGDFAALPNLAVVRGFVRAYAKVLKLDAAPLVAMIEIAPAAGVEAAPARREIAATFSETRFPSMTQRSSSRSAGWLIALVLLVLGAVVGAYELGYISPALLMRGNKAPAAAAAASASAASAAPAPQVETTLVKPDAEPASTVQSPSVPLISVPPPAAAPSSDTSPSAGVGVAAGAPAPTATAPAPKTPELKAADSKTAAPAPAAAGENALVVTVNEDSWIEVRRSQGAPLIARLVKAGNTETFNLTEPVRLVVGNPAGVVVTLRGETLAVKPVAGATIARLNLK